MMNGNGYVSRLGNWAHQPFTSQMNLGGWFLFTGLILILAWFWTRVLRHVQL
jgi:hypothetical protein